jgi:RNA polymerase sigma-70 factor (ECF subfamily)
MSVTTQGAEVALAGPDQDADALQRQLAERFLAGNRQAAAELIALLEPRVRRLAYRLLGWRGDVDDVVQNVFMIMIAKLYAFGWRSSLQTWLMTLTVNQCRKRHRRGLAVIRWWTRRGGTLTQPPSPDERLIEQQAGQRVRQAVRALPQRYREVVVLHYLEGMDIAAVAQALSLKRGTVEVRLHRARSQLKETLGDLVEE